MLRPLILVLAILSFFTAETTAQEVRRRPRPVKRIPSIYVPSNFNGGEQGWNHDFSDFAEVTRPSMDLFGFVAKLPDELGNGLGYHLHGINRSDDLFMFLARKLTTADGVQPGRRYTLVFEIVFASDAQNGCPGAGGAPGESVILKAGGSPLQPVPLPPDAAGYRALSVDKGDQTSGGEAASVVGNIANGDSCGLPARYVSLRRRHVHPTPVTASAEGEIWLLVGTDSGYEGETGIYYQQINVTLLENN